MTSTVDEKNCLPLPQAKPGDVFKIEPQSDGRVLLVPVSVRSRKRTPEEVEKALDNWTAKTEMKWEELRTLTRNG